MFQQPWDFRDESEALYQLLLPLSDADFQRKTQFKNWTGNEIITHLHMWNWAADCALHDEAAFTTFVTKVHQESAGVGLRPFENRWIGALRGRALLETWRKLYLEVAERFSKADPKRRVKWAGPDMSVRSSITARLMETWAHGQALYDLEGVVRKDSDRIKNIAVLGVNTFGWTFATRKQTPPSPVPHVRLTGPSGELWLMNEELDTDLIEGSATEFCQVVTQVRNIADTKLRVVGDSARQWMSVAQCFAGAPNPPPPQGTRFTQPVAAR